MHHYGINTNILHLTFSRTESLQEYLMKKQRINHISNIMLKGHNILPTRISFFISSAGKIESVLEYKINLFE